MASKAAAHQLEMWPHFKTHQSAEVGNWFREFGVECITVSSLKMARYFAENGWQNIHIAFPIWPIQLELEYFKNLNLSFNLANKEQLNHLQSLGVKANCFIELDADYGRTSLAINNIEGIRQLIGLAANSNVAIKGFYVHNGKNYNYRSTQKILESHNQVCELLSRLKLELGSHLKTIMGDTPGCSLANSFNGVDAISAGNFVFYDIMQEHIGSCHSTEQVLELECQVVDQINAQKWVVHCGSVHLSKDALTINNQTIFGKAVARIRDERIPIQNAFLTSLSQEHGILENVGKTTVDVKAGDRIALQVVHSCLTAACMGGFWINNRYFGQFE
ncbi:MAG: alanine racemase [Bacteroidetes bacterium]|nr:alanine racemase [Bacteroidota bacterium]